MQRNQLEVDSLDERPNHPILCQGSPVALVQLLLWTGTLHDGHAAEEDKQVGAGKDGLICSHSGDDFEVLVGKDDLVLQELEPGRGGWTKDSCRRWNQR